MRSLPNSVIFLIALLLSAASVLLLFRFIQEQKRKGVVPGRVVVAKVDIAAQQLINVEMIDIKMLPMAEVPPNSLNALESAVGKVARVAIKQGDVISAKDVLSESENLIGFLPINFRAMTIIVRQNPGEANLYHFGQTVDILVTLKDTSRLVTRTILQNVRILNKQPPKLDIEKGAQDVSYTFAVSPKDAEKLALAEREGTLQIVVRSQNDTQTVSTEGTSSEQIFGRTGATAGTSSGEAQQGPSMEVIRGTELEVKTFQQETPPPYEPGEAGKDQAAVGVSTETSTNTTEPSTPSDETPASSDASKETVQ